MKVQQQAQRQQQEQRQSRLLELSVLGGWMRWAAAVEMHSMQPGYGVDKSSLLVGQAALWLLSGFC